MTGKLPREEQMNKGGARYRDERDAPVDEDAEVDETDVEPNHDFPEPLPVDPSQVPTDRIIPDPDAIPGRGGILPGSDPYQPPPPGAPQ